MMPKYGREAPDVLPRVPKGPGLRWWRGCMALKRCVSIVAPAWRAEVAVS